MSYRGLPVRARLFPGEMHYLRLTRVEVDSVVGALVDRLLE